MILTQNRDEIQYERSGKVLLTQKPSRMAYDEQLIRQEDNLVEEKKEVKSPFKWIGTKDGIFDVFESLYPNSSTPSVGIKDSSVSKIGSLLLSTDKTKSQEAMEGIKCVVEPFMGGAANSVYLYQKYPTIEKFFGCDVLNDMINFYWTLQYYSNDFMLYFNTLTSRYNDMCHSPGIRGNYFVQVRDWFNEMRIPLQSEKDGISVERAAGFYFLHLASFNRSYRTNQKGLFNSTASNIPHVAPPEGSVENLKEMLDTKLTVALCDYRKSLDYISHVINPTATYGEYKASKDETPIRPSEIFVYIDPPSSLHGLPGDIHNPNIFTYSKKTMIELADFCNELSALRVKWLLTVDDSCIDVFLDACEYSVNVKPLINTAIRNPSKRVKEVFVYNYRERKPLS